MLQRIIHRFLLRRHFWRYATFSEVAELYASRTMRIFALRLVSVFTSVYLYQNGFSLVFIAFFWGLFYLLKVPFSWPSAQIAAQYGPKHGTLVSNIVSAIAMVLLAYINEPHVGIYALFIWCALQAFSSTLNDLCYLIDFSKVKDMEHAGKEIGYMNIFEKVSTGLSPIIGGLLALWFGPAVIMLLSSFLFLMSAAPLLTTAEPTKTHRPLDFRAFPWRRTWRTFLAESAVGFDVFATGTAWTLFMTVVVFTHSSGSNQIYADVGLVTSITIFVALLASYSYGKLIDRRRGLQLLIISTIMNALVHGSRIFITTPVGVVYTNAVNEAATTGYSMAFMRGMFDTADRSEHRIEYLFIIEMVVNTGAALGAALLGVLLLFFNDVVSLKASFVITGLISLLIATPKFVLYRR